MNSRIMGIAALTTAAGMSIAAWPGALRAASPAASPADLPAASPVDAPGGPAAPLPDTAAAAPWRTLFDGRITGAFRGWVSPDMPAGWHVVDGALAKEGRVDELITREQFGNFELELDWNIGKEGNSGVFYRGTREYDHIYWSAPEYQLLDDANAPDGRSRLTAAGSVYGVYASPAGIVKPYGEWNTTRIVVRGAHVEHWLNGRLIIAYDLGSPDWQARVAAGKFAQYPHYGLAPRGFIGIQGDHPGDLKLRRIRIRELP